MPKLKTHKGTKKVLNIRQSGSITKLLYQWEDLVVDIIQVRKIQVQIEKIEKDQF